ncbi:MAG: sugar ABC transporter substrate-binding protein [Moorea sp. SIO2B7]|nr:sugar ABC transporter substrate-binding protein [Moorena sp. SIO2B7]
MSVNPVYLQLLTGKGWKTSKFAALLLVTFNTLSMGAVAQQETMEAVVPTFSETNPASLETAYRLGPGDSLKIDILNVPEYSGQYLVLVDGTISLPIIGEIKAEGSTISEITQVISQRYSEYIRRPITSVSLIAPRPLKIAIAGEVNNPGTYIVDSAQGQQFPSVTSIIQLAGGLTTAAEVREVKVRRSIQGVEQVVVVNLWELLQQGNLSQDIVLRDRDTIFIPTTANIDVTETRQLAAANFGIKASEPLNIAVVGEVNRPGSYKVPPDGQDQPPRVTQVIQLAGGIKPLANIRQIKVLRFTRKGTQQSIELDLWDLLQTGNIDQDLILQEGDTIEIPKAETIDPKEAESIATASFSPATIGVNVVGEVQSPGSVNVPPNTPLNQALLAAGGFDKRRARQGSVQLIRLNPNGTVVKRKIKIDFAEGINEKNNPILRNNDVIVVKRSGVTRFSDTISTILSPVGNIFSLFNFLQIFRNF